MAFLETLLGKFIFKPLLTFIFGGLAVPATQIHPIIAFIMAVISLTFAVWMMVDITILVSHLT